MPGSIRLAPHLTDDELHDHFRRARDPVERSRWHFLWLLASGMTAAAVAGVTGYSAYRIGQIARCRNERGRPAGATASTRPRDGQSRCCRPSRRMSCGKRRQVSRHPIPR